jgi:hypothetical protein
MSKIVLENDTDPTVNKSNLKLDDDLKKPSYFIRIPILCLDLILVGLISLLGILIIPDQFLNNEIINIVLVAFPVIFWIIYSILTGILFKQSIGHLVLGTTLNTKSRFQAIFAILFSPTLFTDILLKVKITRLKKPPIFIRLTTILASLSSLVIIPGLLLYTGFLVILAKEAPLVFDNSIPTSQIPLKGSIESTSTHNRLKQPEENKNAPKSDQGSTELEKENKVIQQISPKETVQDIKLRQLEREKAELKKQAERAQKTADYYKGVENFRKENAERAKAEEKRNLEREAERRKINEELEEKRLAEELARKIEQEEQLAEQQYNSCISNLNYCIDNAPRQVSSLGNTSAYAPALNAVVRECQRKYQCIR